MPENKEDLRKMINKAILYEESGIAILGQTYRSFIDSGQVAGLKEGQKKKIIENLNLLIKDSEKHRKLLEALTGKVS